MAKNWTTLIVTENNINKVPRMHSDGTNAGCQQYTHYFQDSTLCVMELEKKVQKWCK
jgi:hypothetical protein